jgi:hypothetical protein
MLGRAMTARTRETSMTPRKNLASAALAAVALAACGPMRAPEGGSYEPPTVCVGACAPPLGGPGGDGHADGGLKGPGGGEDPSAQCAAIVADGGTTVMSIREVRDTACVGQRVRVQGVIVHSIESTFVDSADGGSSRAMFWVADPARATDGIYVRKGLGDTFAGRPASFLPEVGDVLDIEGSFQAASPFRDRTGYRRQLGSEDAVQEPQRVMQLTVVRRQQALPDAVAVDAGVLDAKGGTLAAGGQYAGARLHLPWPLVITNPSPAALERTNSTGAQSFAGFEVTGGVLVSDFKTSAIGSTDGGTGTCDWRAIALAAEAQGKKVEFPNGITGVWDTYTYAACENGTLRSDCNPRKPGTIPGTDGGSESTLVLYPLDCSDLQGGKVDLE